jgi:hypothetical protein
VPEAGGAGWAEEDAGFAGWAAGDAGFETELLAAGCLLHPASVNPLRINEPAKLIFSSRRQERWRPRRSDPGPCKLGISLFFITILSLQLFQLWGRLRAAVVRLVNASRNAAKSAIVQFNFAAALAAEEE